MAVPVSIKGLIAWAQRALERSESPRLDAELLLGDTLGVDRTYLFARHEQAVTAEQRRRYVALVARRRSGMPVAQLLGRKEFWSLDLEVGAETLVPRPETETLVGLALAALPAQRATRAVDLGTGCGAVALAVARERPLCQVLAVDDSPGAIAVAARNRRRIGVGNLQLVRGHWAASLGSGLFHAVMANPPYLAAGDAGLAALRGEPRHALVAGATGLECLHALAGSCRTLLVRGGWLLLEHGWEQGSAVRSLLQGSGFVEVVTQRDLAGHERVTQGRRP